MVAEWLSWDCDGIAAALAFRGMTDLDLPRLFAALSAAGYVIVKASPGATKPLRVPGDFELPGMWENADLIGGQTDT